MPSSVVFVLLARAEATGTKILFAFFVGSGDDYVKPEKDTSEAKEAHLTVHTVQLCENVNECYMASNLVDENANLVDENAHENVEGNSLMAIINTACTRTVAGYRWFEDYGEIRRPNGH